MIGSAEALIEKVTAIGQSWWNGIGEAQRLMAIARLNSDESETLETRDHVKVIAELTLKFGVSRPLLSRMQLPLRQDFDRYPSVTTHSRHQAKRWIISVSGFFQFGGELCGVPVVALIRIGGVHVVLIAISDISWSPSPAISPIMLPAEDG